MKKLKYLLLFSACIFVSPLITHAECSYQRVAELSKIASNVQFSYSYDIGENGTPTFTMNITNITDDIYVEDHSTGTILKTGEHNLVYNQYGTTLKYDIFSNDPDCENEPLLTQNINLPNYNLFSSTENCKKYPNFKYCQTWMNTAALSQEKFSSELSKYVEQEENSDATQTNKNIIDLIYENIVLVIVIIIMIITIPSLMFLKRRI